MISVIVPTLNEEQALVDFLCSISEQSWSDFEVIVVDGGSKDKTTNVAKDHGARVVILPQCHEFPSRNIGAKEAKGDILVFTCADVFFPRDLLEKVQRKFARETTLVALSCPGVPFDAPLVGRVEYELYNRIRYFLAKLPSNVKRFSTSTNFLAVRRESFIKTGGFTPDDVNADGILGRQLKDMGKIDFSFDTYVNISARRMRNMGFLSFNRHYLYVLENFVPALSRAPFMKRAKETSRSAHRKMRE